jgi:hypothetical protein
MATYIQGVTDYLPQIQPFQPDLNFLGNILQTKQSRYDAAHKQLSNVYGTMLNSPMLRDKNISNRDNFFKMIQQDIHKMSGVDLSLQQNVDSAQQVFKALYDDQDIVKDMTWTRNYRNQKERGAAFKLCTDPEKCGGGWWEGGDQYLDYKAQEFKNATDEDARNFGDVEYVPYQNFQKDAMKWAKDMGFEIKYDDFSKAPGYITHIKNGEAMIQPLAKHFLSVFGSDPKYTKYFEALAYNTRKAWVNAKIGEYNSEEEASLAYMEQFYTAINNQVKDGKKQADEDSDAAQAKLTMAEKNAAEQGIQGDENDWLRQLSGYKDEVESINKVKDIYTNAENTLSNMNINANNINLYLSNFDKMMGLQMLERESINASSAYANLTTEVSYDVDAKQLAASERAYNEQKAIMEEGYVKYDESGNPIEYVPGRKAMKEAWLEREKAGIEGGVTTEQRKSLAREYLGGGSEDVTFLPKVAGAQTGELVPDLATKTNLAKSKALDEESVNYKASANDFIFTHFKNYYQNSAEALQKPDIQRTLGQVLYLTDKSIKPSDWNKVVKGFLNGDPEAMTKVEQAYKSNPDIVYKALSKFSRPSKIKASGKGQYSTFYSTAFSNITSDPAYLENLGAIEKNIQETTQAQEGMKNLQNENNKVATSIFKAQNKNLPFVNLIPELVKAAKYGTYNPINSPFTEGSLNTPAAHTIDNWTSLLSSFYKTARGKVISDFADKRAEAIKDNPLLNQLTAEGGRLVYKRTNTALDEVNKIFLGKNTGKWTPIDDKDGIINQRLIAFEKAQADPTLYNNPDSEINNLYKDWRKSKIKNISWTGGLENLFILKPGKKNLSEIQNPLRAIKEGFTGSMDEFIETEIKPYKLGTVKDKIAFDVLKVYNNEDTKKSWLSAYAEKANSWMDPDYQDYSDRSTSYASAVFEMKFSPAEPTANLEALSLIKAINNAKSQGELKIARYGGFHDKEAFMTSYEENGEFYEEQYNQINNDLRRQLQDPKLATKDDALNLDIKIAPNVAFGEKGMTAVEIRVPQSYINARATSNKEGRNLFTKEWGKNKLIFLMPDTFLPEDIRAKTTGNNDDIAMRGLPKTSYPVNDGGIVEFTKVIPDPSQPNNYTYTAQVTFFVPDPNNPGNIIPVYGTPKTGIGKDVDFTALKNEQIRILEEQARKNRQDPNFKKKLNQ